MIPKIIYYCWFGGPKPANIQDRIKQWHKILEGYQIVEINEQNFDYTSYAFTKKAYEAKKYAYVSDVARLSFLNQTGGIYLDTDVDVLKPFDAYLEHDMLQLSMEYYGYELTGVNVGTIIAPAHHPVLKQVLERITQSEYHSARPTINMYMNEALPKLVYKDRLQEFPHEQTRVYPTRVFCRADKQSVTIHRYDNSWGDALSFSKKIRRFCGVMLKKLIGRERFKRIMQEDVHE